MLIVENRLDPEEMTWIVARQGGVVILAIEPSKEDLVVGEEDMTALVDPLVDQEGDQAKARIFQPVDF